MPPKIKITKDTILREAIELVRNEGEGALNARALAARIGCSTQPVFSNYPSMTELKNDIILSAVEIYRNYTETEIRSGKDPIYKASGMAYIRFAKEEKALFRMLLMRDRSKSEQENDEDVIPIRFIQDKFGLSLDMARLFHLEMWTFVHGIAVMYATSYLDLDEEIVSGMLSDIFEGLKSRHLNTNGDNEI